MPFVEIGNVRLLYLHVPKTGGGTVEHWLKTLGPVHFLTVGRPTSLRSTPQHFRMSDFRALFAEGYFTHAVMTVRNPFDRIASEYRMRAILGGQGFWKAWPSFSLWLESNLAAAGKDPFHLDSHLRPQWEYLGSRVEVLRYEDGLPAILSRLADLLSVPPPETVPVLHDTRTSPIVVEWDTVDRLRVAEFYRRDFEQFGYDPG